MVIPRINGFPARRFLARGAWLFLVLSSLAGPIEGDVIRFKDGRSLEGKVVKEEKGFVEFRTKFGTVKIERERIASITYGESIEDLLAKKVKATDMTDPDAVFELALWCKEKGLKKEYRRYLEKTLALDDQHAGANKEVGNIRYEGKWFTAEGLKKYKAEKEARMKKMGWVFYNGEWMPETEAHRLMGYQEWEGKWIPMMEYYHKLGERDIPTFFGYAMNITDSEHFTIRSKYPEDMQRQLLDYCELEFEHFLRTFEPNETEQRMMTYYPVPIYILPDLETSDHFVKSGYIKRYNPPKQDMERYRPQTNFSIYFPRPLVVLTEGRHLSGAQDRMTSQIGYMTHHVGHVLIRRFKRGGKVPGWVETGTAHYYEGLSNFYQTLSVCEFRGFENTLKWIHGWSNFLEWKKGLSEARNHRVLPTVRGLFPLEIETMNTREMAKAWSVVSFLLETHRKAFVEFARHALAPYRGEKELSQEAAWDLAFKDVTPEQIEEDWRAWIVKQPIGTPPGGPLGPGRIPVKKK